MEEEYESNMQNRPVKVKAVKEEKKDGYNAGQLEKEMKRLLELYKMYGVR